MHWVGWNAVRDQRALVRHSKVHACSVSCHAMYVGLQPWCCLVGTFLWTEYYRQMTAPLVRCFMAIMLLVLMHSWRLVCTDQ